MDLEKHLTPKTIAAIYEHYTTSRKDRHSNRLGGSMIGAPCDRALWYGFRHADKSHFTGRQLRLFNTGHREEERVIADLRAAGCTVWDRDPDAPEKQIGFTSANGHFVVYLDGVVEGLKESLKPHTLEVKSANDKNFKTFKSKGLEVWKPTYYAQAQIGMHLSGLERCAFIVVNKNDDDMWMERIRYDPAMGMQLIARASAIIFAEQPPARISNDPAYFECKFCTFHNVCHMGKLPEINCRTCAHATPEKDGDGRWSCAKRNAFGTVCSKHIFNPYMMPWSIDDAGSEWVQYVDDDGEVIRNGDGNSLEIASRWLPL